MTDPHPEELRYPVGRFSPRGHLASGERDELVEEIAALPANLRSAVSGLSEAQLDTPYRAGGWTVRQLVHHVADSHVNSYVRLRLALTEDLPTIRPYDQAAWAELHDARTASPEVSLALLDAVHERWTGLLRTLPPEDWRRKFVHPETGEVDLETNLQLYAWHGRHHLAHVTALKEREGWS